jgi:hypothetical protein
MNIARFANRQDAEDDLRFLRRFIPQAAFPMMFEPPEPETGTGERGKRDKVIFAMGGDRSTIGCYFLYYGK